LARYDAWGRRVFLVNVFLGGVVVGAVSVIAVASLLR
jgi:hypothetical protein